MNDVDAITGWAAVLFVIALLVWNKTNPDRVE